MARPSIFISSTYYDLKHIRSSLEQFVLSLGYEPILSEKGNVAYSSSLPLDESCYKQVQNCDIFVVIIGGRYGSEVSETRGQGDQNKFFDTYDSVTKREFENAYSSDTPVYILIDKSVFSEYETFQRNSGNETINYAHVDSVNIFKFIEIVLSKPRNNPVFQFEKESEMEDWLKEQWAGLFKDILAERLESKRLASLSDKVSELGNINTTLKHYMEAIIDNISGGDESVKEVIVDEEKRLEIQRVTNKLLNISLFKELLAYDISIDLAKKTFSEAISIDGLAYSVEDITNGKVEALNIIEYWKENSDIIQKIQRIRELLNKETINFKKE